MKSKLAGLLTAVAMAATVATPGLAGEPALKARQSLMQLFAFNLGQLGAMAKGTVDYNTDAATAAANNLLAAASMNQMAFWPQGSDSTSMPGKTRALPEIWATYPAIEDKAKALTAAATVMAAAAGTDLASLRGAIGAVGGACGGCHKVFRMPK